MELFIVHRVEWHHEVASGQHEVRQESSLSMSKAKWIPCKLPCWTLWLLIEARGRLPVTFEGSTLVALRSRRIGIAAFEAVTAIQSFSLRLLAAEGWRLAQLLLAVRKGASVGSKIAAPVLPILANGSLAQVRQVLQFIVAVSERALLRITTAACLVETAHLCFTELSDKQSLFLSRWGLNGGVLLQAAHLTHGV